MFRRILNTVLIIVEKIKESFRSSRPDVFCEKGVLKNFEKFKGKRPC